MNDHDFANVSSHQRFELGWNRLQIAIEVLVALIVGAGLLGLLGTGPLSSAEVTIADQTATIRYDRILRRTVQSTMTLDLAQPAIGSQIEVEVPDTFLDTMDVVSTSPRASAMRAEPAGVVYTFAFGPSGMGQIVFSLKPRHAADLTSVLRMGQSRIALHQIVLP